MLKKRIGIFAICFALVASYLLGGAFLKKNESHAVVLDWIAGKCLDSVFNVVNGTFLGITGTMADSDNSTAHAIGQFLTSADNLIFAGSAEDASKEILAELAAMETQISNVNTQIQSTLSKMFAYQISHDKNDIIGNLDTLYDNQSKILDRYNAYLASVNAYAGAVVDEAAGKDGADAAKAEKDMEKKQEKLDVYFGKKTFMEELDRDFHDIVAKNTCSYFPTSSADPSDKGNKNSSNLYLQEVWDYLEISVPFEHQKYEQMTAAANDCAKDITMVLQVARAWYDYQYAKYAADPAKAGQLEDYAEEYAEILNKCIHAISDVSQQCEEKVGSFMRPYDLETSKEMNYVESGIYTVIYIDPFAYVPIPVPVPIVYKTTARETKPEMDFYRVCVNETPYLILKDTGASSTKSYVERTDSEYIYFYYNYTQSRDYKNFYSTKDGLYTMPSDYKGVLPITGTGAYKGAGSNLSSYLINNGQLTQLPKDGAAYVLTRKIDEVGSADYINGNAHFTAHWCSTNINPDDTKKAEVAVDFANAYNSNNKVFNILPGNKSMMERSSVSVRISDDRGSLAVTDDSGNDMKGKYPMAKTNLKLKLKIKDGAQLRSLKWVSKDGKTKETIADTDSIALAQPDKDGTYTFTYPMPYQDCTFRADFTNEEEGEGTEENPYLISSAADLQDYLVKASEENDYNNAHYKLTADISYTRENIKGGGRFYKFTGTFDGNGHSIEGHDSTLFEVIKETGIVKNLNLVSKESMIGDDSAFAGENNGLITGCSYRGAETGKEYFNSRNGDFGIFARENRKNGVIRNCYNAATVRSDGNTGGIACNNQGTIINCYNTGSFAYYWNPDKKTSAAGIAVHNDGLVENCYNTWVSREPGDSPIVSINGREGNIADAFYKDWGAVFGTRLNDSQMKGDYMMNILNKNVAKTKDLCQWIIKEGTNNGYPILGTVPDRYALSTDIKGKGSLTITGDEDKEIHKAVSGQAVKVTAAPEDGRQVDNLKLYDEKGKTIKKLEVKADEKGIVKTSFAMPEQNVTVHVKFVKQETPAAGKNETDGKEETGQKDIAVQEKGSGPIYDKAALTDKDTGITVAGDAVDTRAVLKVEAYDETDPRHEQIEDAASDDVLASYDVSLALVDEQGKEIKADTAKFKGTLDVAFPIKESDREKDLKVLHGSEDGLKFEDGGLKDDGLYHVSVSHLSPFAVVEHQEDLKADLSAGETLDPGSGGSAWIWIVIACIAAAAITATIILTVRKRRKKKGTSQ